jgi:hypothetical protein
MVRLSFGLESSGSPDITVRMGKDVTTESSEPTSMRSPKFGRVWFAHPITQFMSSTTTIQRCYSRLEPKWSM